MYKISRKACNENNTSGFEDNTLIADPRPGVGRTSGHRSATLPSGPVINVLPSKHEVLLYYLSKYWFSKTKLWKKYMEYLIII